LPRGLVIERESTAKIWSIFRSERTFGAVIPVG
jgi:hypothetical protein